jgi:hypothetical protein
VGNELDNGSEPGNHGNGEPGTDGNSRPGNIDKPNDNEDREPDNESDSDGKREGEPGDVDEPEFIGFDDEEANAGWVGFGDEEANTEFVSFDDGIHMDEDHDYGGRHGHTSPPRIEVQQVDFTTPRGRQFSKRRHSRDISSGSRHSKASKRSVSSVAPSVRGPPGSRSASPSVFDLQGASRVSGGLFRGKAVGDIANMADYGLFY